MFPGKTKIKRILESKGMRPGSTIWYLLPDYYGMPDFMRFFIVSADQMVDITKEVAQLLDMEYSDSRRALMVSSFGDGDDDAAGEGEDMVRMMSIILYDCIILKSMKV
jgi:hypothetical protein